MNCEGVQHGTAARQVTFDAVQTAVALVEYPVVQAVFPWHGR